LFQDAALEDKEDALLSRIDKGNLEEQRAFVPHPVRLRSGVSVLDESEEAAGAAGQVQDGRCRRIPAAHEEVQGNQRLPLHHVLQRWKEGLRKLDQVVKANQILQRSKEGLEKFDLVGET
jgi:hypothetical protein